MRHAIEQVFLFVCASMTRAVTYLQGHEVSITLAETRLWAIVSHSADTALERRGCLVTALRLDELGSACKAIIVLFYLALAYVDFTGVVSTAAKEANVKRLEWSAATSSLRGVRPSPALGLWSAD